MRVQCSDVLPFSVLPFAVCRSDASTGITLILEAFPFG